MITLSAICLRAFAFIKALQQRCEELEGAKVTGPDTNVPQDPKTQEGTGPEGQQQPERRKQADQKATRGPGDGDGNESNEEGAAGGGKQNSKADAVDSPRKKKKKKKERKDKNEERKEKDRKKKEKGVCGTGAEVGHLEAPKEKMGERNSTASTLTLAKTTAEIEIGGNSTKCKDRRKRKGGEAQDQDPLEDCGLPGQCA